MQMLVLSDIHGQTKGLASLAERAKGVDLVVVNGDLTHFGDGEEARRVIGELKTLGPAVYAVPGNCDNAEVASVIESEGISIEGKSIEYNGSASRKNLFFYGIGGALPGPVSTPNEYTEEELKEKLTAVPLQKEDGKLLLVCHQPPAKTVADRAMKVKHVGSEVLAEWMGTARPRLILTGHIHESHGYEWYGETCVLNPGAFKEGRYAVVDIALDSSEKGPAEQVTVEMKTL